MLSILLLLPALRRWLAKRKLPHTELEMQKLWKVRAVAIESDFGRHPDATFFTIRLSTLLARFHCTIHPYTRGEQITVCATALPQPMLQSDPCHTIRSTIDPPLPNPATTYDTTPSPSSTLRTLPHRPAFPAAILDIFLKYP